MKALHTMTAKELGKEIIRRQEIQSQAAEAVFSAASSDSERFDALRARLGTDDPRVKVWTAARLSLQDADSEARRRYGTNAVCHDAHWPLFLAQVK